MAILRELNHHQCNDSICFWSTKFLASAQTLASRWTLKTNFQKKSFFRNVYSFTAVAVFWMFSDRVLSQVARRVGSWPRGAGFDSYKSLFSGEHLVQKCCSRNICLRTSDVLAMQRNQSFSNREGQQLLAERLAWIPNFWVWISMLILRVIVWCY